MTQTAISMPIGQLSADDAEIWARFRENDPSLASPYFSLDYLKTLDTVHPGIEVIRICSDDCPVGYLPYRRDLIGTARTPDGLLGDLHGVIAAPASTIDLEFHLRACGLGGYAFSAIPFQQARHGLTGLHGEGNQVMDLSQGYAGYLAERYAASSSFRRTHRKIEKLLERADADIVHDTFDEAAFKRLIELKQEGYSSAGHFDVFSLEWPEALLRALACNPAGEIAGVLSVMHVGGELAAACFCMRSASVMHYWFPGYETRFAELKPGHAMLFSLAEWAAGQGIREFHLGLGNIQYKRQMATYAAPVRAGTLAVSAPQKLVAGFHAWSAAREAREQKLGRLSAKLARKLERITVVGRLSA